MTQKFDFDFNSITGEKDVDQARALRLVLAIIEGDMAQLAAIAEETVRDARGWEMSTWELVIGMAGTIGQGWVQSTDKETAVDGIRAALMGATARGDLDV